MLLSCPDLKATTIFTSSGVFPPVAILLHLLLWPFTFLTDDFMTILGPPDEFGRFFPFGTPLLSHVCKVLLSQALGLGQGCPRDVVTHAKRLHILYSFCKHGPVSELQATGVLTVPWPAQGLLGPTWGLHKFSHPLCLWALAQF